MKKLLFSILTGLTVFSMPALADVGFYYGSLNTATLPLGGAAGATAQNVVAVVDYANHQIQYVTLSAPTVAGAAFDYKIGTAQSLYINSFTSNNGVSFTYFSNTVTNSTATTIDDTQMLLYGANVLQNLRTSAQVAVPATIQGNIVVVKKNPGADTGSASGAQYNLNIVLAASVYENDKGHTLAQAISDTDGALALIKGHKVP